MTKESPELEEPEKQTESVEPAEARAGIRTWRCKAVFALFDSNGKCALSVWKDRSDPIRPISFR